MTPNLRKRALAWKLPEHPDWYQSTRQFTTIKKVEEQFLLSRSFPGVILLIRFDLIFSTYSLPTAPLLFDASLNLGSIHRLLKELSKAEQLYNKALEIAVSMKDFDKEILAKIHLAVCLLDRGELKQAINTYFEPLLEFKTAMRKHTRGLYLHYFGGACRSAADWGRAKEYLREALDLAKEVKDVGLISSCCGELGNVYRSEGR